MRIYESLRENGPSRTKTPLGGDANLVTLTNVETHTALKAASHRLVADLGSSTSFFRRPPWPRILSSRRNGWPNT
jgi:hypothetical protein